MARPAIARVAVTRESLKRAQRVTGRLGPLLGPVPAGTMARPVRLPSCGAELVRAPGASERNRVVLYAHGGGFALGSARLWRAPLARLSALAGAPVLAVDYRRVPDNRVAEGVEDCVSGYQWLLDQGYAADEIVLAGDSAGGNLVFSVALHAMRRRLPRPAAIAVASPWLDLADSGASRRANQRNDPYLSAELVASVARLCADDAPLDDPLHSPLHAELSGLPPTLIQVGSIELLRSDGEQMAERLAQEGVSCELQVWRGQIHAFPLFAGVIPEGRAALREMAAFLVRESGRGRDVPGKVAPGTS